MEAAAAHADLRGPLSAWYQIASRAEWSNLNDIRRTFSTADMVGNCTVFNIKGNSYRLITWINFASHKIFVRQVLTHTEYDKGGWKNECFGD